MLRSPKTKFVTGPHKAAFEAIAGNIAFEEASLAAMLMMLDEQPTEPSPNQGASSADRMAGARRYLELLCTMSQDQPKPNAAKGQNLDYEAGV